MIRKICQERWPNTPTKWCDNCFEHSCERRYPLSKERPRSKPKPEPEAFCHCNAELRWDTGNGGHWLHLRTDIVDHEPIPMDQPIHDEPRIVIGSIDDLTMTEDGKFTPMVNPGIEREA